MKKFVFVSLVIFVFFILASCSQNADLGSNNYLSYLAQNNISSSYRSYKVITSTENNQVFFSSDKRSILPDFFSVSDLDFYIYGENKVTGQVLTFKTSSGNSSCIKIDIISNSADGTEGCFYIDLDGGRYSLTLAAVKKGKIFDKNNISLNTVLIGDATVDPRVDSIRFCLSGKRFFNTSGMNTTVRLGLYSLGWTYSDYNDATSTFACNVGIYKKDVSNTTVKEKTTFILPHYDSESEVPDSVDDFPQNFIYTINTPGEYNFCVRFYDLNNPSCSYYYSDTIMLLGNQTTEAIIKIPNVINSKPKAPSGMTCGYIDPSDKSSEKFGLNIEWKDNSYNEEYFKLELMDLGGSDVISDTYKEYVKCVVGKSNVYDSGARDYAWDYLATSPDFEVTTIQNKYFIDMGLVASGEVKGSLSRNCESVLFPVLLGERYLVRMCAVNAAGRSSYVYPEIYDAVYRNTAASAWVWDYLDEGNSNITMNRFKIDYHLSNGEFFDDSTMNEVTNWITLESAEFFSQSANGFALMNPINVSYTNNDEYHTGTASLKVEKSSEYYPWKGWRLNSIIGTVVVDSASVSSYRYSGYAGMSLYPDYEKQADSKILLTAYSTENMEYGVPGSTIALLPSATGDMSFVPVPLENDKITLSKSDYKSLFLLIKDDFYLTDVYFSSFGGKSEFIGTSCIKDVVRPVTTNDWQTKNETGDPVTVSVSHVKYKIQLDKYSSGTYNIYVYAKKYYVTDPCQYIITLVLTD